MVTKDNRLRSWWKLAVCLVLAGCGDTPELPAEVRCQVGLWRLDDGQPLIVAPGFGSPLFFRHFDGRFGHLAPDGDRWVAREGGRREGPFVTSMQFSPCTVGKLTLAFTGPDGSFEQREGSRLALRTTDVRFESHTTTLQGRLVLPEGQGPWPLAVLVHGSERDSAIERYPWQHFLPADGVAAFVYDKRGTGRSGGEYTQDFALLADDAVAALAAARGLAPGAFSEAGFLGGSQGAWIGPLAAARTPVDFVVALYGFAESPLAEDREEVADQLRRRGYGEDVLTRAREVTDATGVVQASNFEAGFEALAEVKARYAAEPWFPLIEGEFTGDLLRYPAWALRIAGPWFSSGTSWRYDPATVVPTLTLDQLWVLADEDTEAPSRETRRRLEQWQAEGRAIDLVTYPGTEHGMFEFEEREGARIYLRHAPGYFALLSHWIRTRTLDIDLGRATVRERLRSRPLDNGRRAKAVYPADTMARDA